MTVGDWCSLHLIAFRPGSGTLGTQISADVPLYLPRNLGTYLDVWLTSPKQKHFHRLPICFTVTSWIRKEP